MSKMKVTDRKKYSRKDKELPVERMLGFFVPALRGTPPEGETAMSKMKVTDRKKYGRKEKELPVERMLGPTDVRKRLHISTATLNSLIEAGVIPAPLKLSSRIRRWHAADIEAFLESSRVSAAA